MLMVGLSFLSFSFFFFQAEDGIRDKLVTGVQTCALPICTKNIQVYFRTAPGKAQERVVVFVGRWLATARHRSVVQSQSRSVFAEREHNMDKADARLIGLDNRLRNLALGLELLKAAFYCC